LAEIIVNDRDEKTDSRGKTYVLEVVAILVPESQQFPSGTKYSYHAGYKDQLILRYDNSNDSHVSKHHKHVIEDGNEVIKPLKTKPESREQLHKLFQKWIKEVEKNVK